jgi:hypothetical protein
MLLSRIAESTASPDPTEERGSYFCCKNVGPDASGDDCTLILQERVALCGNVLYCAGSYTNAEGDVTCH